MVNKSNPKGDKSKPEDAQDLKKKQAKINYLSILAGHTAGNAVGLGNLKTLHDHSEKEEKQAKKPKSR